MDVHSNIQDLEVDLGIDSDLEMGNYTGTDNREELSSSDVESEDVDTLAAEEPGGDLAMEQYLQEMFSEKDNQVGESNQGKAKKKSLDWGITVRLMKTKGSHHMLRAQRNMPPKGV
ncbi:hypothetical protein Pyn_25679 [Prunus yedoensis var. nudiflora]|uniref:Uncharacterized protein n=1 Tax=Prunus yedoensis var. nudiflora TaxID=2094558 RepID=A0A314Y7R4_PRUYE|nr:hypothetical protein Pyn_40608 [Prunus yedoensis var. nudiflora]PQQ04285.1 hypothetical protein Pyn_25679 [Prunus yedoensis var. nudiflora]